MGTTQRRLSKVLILFSGAQPDGDDMMGLFRLACEEHDAVLTPGRGALDSEGPFKDLNMQRAYTVVSEREGKGLPHGALGRSLFTEYRHANNGDRYIVCLVQEADDSTPGFLEPAVGSPLWHARNSTATEQRQKKKWSLKGLMGRE
ncbi:hypothetical protein BX285_6683 [Streptomyces sp. 1114.5]|uniref:hypothetical protein n=1 Tax=Streptomyces sp. 1114.5 TaxID=1938830 RepID=UPI000EB0D026|nr:hypothetical protein [Streptomyces sp. 1114.5]RKT09588.1 hypothetical protein BX285_6683 [Streptomyces sp. 1114.5]